MTSYKTHAMNPLTGEIRMCTYEVTVEAHNGCTRADLTGKFASLAGAVAYAKAFAGDWWRDACYSVYCPQTGEFHQGKAN
jgi:hypothetical protein